MSSHGPTDPRNREGYHALEQKALAEHQRVQLVFETAAGSEAGIVGIALAARTICGALFGGTLAVLAVADRLDTLIDCAFDKRIPIRMAGVDDDQHDQDDEGRTE